MGNIMPVSKKQQVRIIGGQWKSRQISFPASVKIRPTPDRVRETLFNWLAPHIVGSRCLDLFAGSGALSFEALSRGANYVVMCDKSSTVINQLLQTAQLLQANTKNFLVYAMEFSLNTPLFIEKQPFDIVFIDPPFQQNLVKPACEWLLKNELIDKNSLVYIETENKLILDLPENFTIQKQGKTSQTRYYLAQLDKNL
jgi:16S rRNA (guanine966-N2)-methyltransferase